MIKNTACGNKDELKAICGYAKELIKEGKLLNCRKFILETMVKYPHSPVPHNLLGLLLEKEGDHTLAMKHFRAAWSLDPTYRPAKQNLDCFGCFFVRGSCAFDESDCPEEEVMEPHNLHRPVQKQEMEKEYAELQLY